MKNKQNSKKRFTYSTDDFMLKLWKHLYRDFASYTVLPKDALKAVETADIAAFRSHNWPFKSQAPIYDFKVLTQMESLFKRYRFENDIYTDAELTELTNRKFLDIQEEIAQSYSHSMKLSTFRVVQKARQYIRKVLGPYNPDVHKSMCRFAKRASQGNKARDSYIDLKLHGPITGSEDQIGWFNDYLATDSLLEQIVGNERVVCDLLNQINVPKSYKILRGINPNTLIGSFYTSGLGKYIEICLRRGTNVDLRFQPQKHGNWARKSSVHRKFVTADMAHASHNFTLPLLNRLLPRDWYNACKLGVIKRVEMDGRVYAIESIMTMGIGFTFPLQTLLFYSIIKSIGDLLKVSGVYSVFGDDLIYPRPIHAYVAACFKDLGFTINEDKTFVDDYFRESCGQDFYHGVDVRPFQPEGSYRRLHRMRYAAFLYQMLNGLLKRWHRVEINQTFRFVISEILRVQACVYQVPLDYPDYSGIQTAHFERFDMEVPWIYPTYDSSQTLKIVCLDMLHSKRVVKHMDAYLWDSLRNSTQQQQLDEDPDYVTEGNKLIPSTEVISWILAEQQPRNYRSFLTGKRLRLKLPVVGEKLPENVKFVVSDRSRIRNRRPK